MSDLVILAIIVLIFGRPMVNTITRNQRKMLKMRLAARELVVDTAWKQEAERLQRELNSVRETSTNYALSLEATISSLERRLEYVEMRNLSLMSDEKARIQNER